MSTDERAFLDAIIAAPDDDTARLVYADWLTENGRPDRGAFIRTEIELARTPPTTEEDERRRRVLIERRDDLLKRHKAVWLKPFLPFAKDSAFERGFVEALEVHASTFLQSAEKWFALTPLTRVRFTVCNAWDAGSASYVWWAERLFTSPLLSRLKVIELEHLQLTADDLTPLAAAPDLSRLRELVLAVNNIRNEGAVRLAAMPQLQGLEVLDLRGNGISDAGARAVAQSPHLGGLKELRMTRNPIRNKTWAVLEERFGDALTS
ncbi:TIGR02996 domain-containing protein [Frigoriglobus tundricola]|nr:TIGR02996 domain-containing protein [Frigoriglobus tundricola]